jgi:hypothetical protein
MIFFTSIANLSDDVGQTRTLTGTMIARSSTCIRTEDITLACLAVLLERIAVKIGFAYLAVVPVSIIEALKALARLGVAISHSHRIRVIIALAGFAFTTRCFRVAVVIVSTSFAARSCIALVTLTYDILCHRVQ